MDPFPQRPARVALLPRGTRRTSAPAPTIGSWFVPRLPEGKPGEPTTDGATPEKAHNKLHLDLHIGPERRSQVVEQLLTAGARKLWDGEQSGSTWVTMADPEGNEFCVA